MSESTETLVIERSFDAPRELVWKAFTDPDQLAQWFGPVGYSVPRETVDIELRVGGHQRMTMVPDDPSYPPGGPMNGTYDEIVENELLVVHEHIEDDMVEFFGTTLLTLRLAFHDDGGKTRLVLTQGPYGEKILGDARKGWGSSFTKLDRLLAA